MFVIFGWNHVTAKPMGDTLPVTCPRCQNTRYWRLRQVTRWFTLFFAPIFPYETFHQLHCPICFCSLVVSGKHLEDALSMRRATSSYVKGGMTVEQYQSLAVSKRPPSLPWYSLPAATPQNNQGTEPA